MNPATILLIIISLCGIYFLFNLITDVIKNKDNLGKGNPFLGLIIGFITDFFDTIGIGSFALTTLLFKATNYLENDKILPGTLNVAHTIPTIFEAYLFIQAVDVEPVTLFSLVAAAVLGSLVGARIIVRLSEQKIQLVMGICLILTSFLIFAKQMGWMDLLGGNNTALGLTGILLFAGIFGNFIFGALMMAGIGLFAPCLAMISLLGMNPKAAFPIMMASCALIQSVATREFIKKGMYSRIAAVTILLGGIVGVFVAYTWVKNMSVTALLWLVAAVVLYTGISMVLKSFKKVELKEA